jgi:hypothetical protein
MMRGLGLGGLRAGYMTGHKGENGGGASPGDLKLLGMTLGAKEKVGGDKVENQKPELYKKSGHH